VVNLLLEHVTDDVPLQNKKAPVAHAVCTPGAAIAQ